MPICAACYFVFQLLLKLIDAVMMDSFVPLNPGFGEKQEHLDSGYDSPDSLHSSSSLPSSDLVTVPSLDDSNPETENDDPNSELVAKLKGKTLNVPTSMLTVFETVGWPILEPQPSKWTDEFAAKYERLRLETHAILDLYALHLPPPTLGTPLTHQQGTRR